MSKRLKEAPPHPPQDLIDLYHCGHIYAIEYDIDLSEDSRMEAQSACHHEGHYEWQAVIHVKGRKSGPELCNPTYHKATISENVYELFLESHMDANRWGYWGITADGKEMVETWEKWVRQEAKDITEYRRLQKKFGNI